MYERLKMDWDEIVFEWDDDKEQRNFSSHGIHFKTAAKAFFDSNALIREDEEHPEEERYNVLGEVGKVLFVVCTVRHENTIRIISARIATKSEKERYKRG